MKLSNDFYRIAKQKEFKRAIIEFGENMSVNGYTRFSCHMMTHFMRLIGFSQKQIKTVLIAYHKFAIGMDIASSYTHQRSAFLCEKVDRPPSWALNGISDRDYERYVERTRKQEVRARKKLVKSFVKYCLTL